MRASVALCEKNDKQSNRKKNNSEGAMNYNAASLLHQVAALTQSQQFQHQTEIFGKLEDRALFPSMFIYVSKMWKFSWWLMTCSFSMIFSLNIMIEVLWPLKILLLLFLKKNLSVMFSFIVMLLPLNSTDLQNGGTMKTVFSYNTIENISLSLYIKLNVCHSWSTSNLTHH